MFCFHTVRFLYVRSHLFVRCNNIIFVCQNNASIYVVWLFYTITNWIYVLYIVVFLWANEMYFLSCLNHLLTSVCVFYRVKLSFNNLYHTLIVNSVIWSRIAWINCFKLQNVYCFIKKRYNANYMCFLLLRPFVWKNTFWI